MNRKLFSKCSAVMWFFPVFLLAVFFFAGCPQDTGQEETTPIKIPIPSVIRGDGKLSIGWAAQTGLLYEVWYGTDSNVENAIKWNEALALSPPVGGTIINNLDNLKSYYVWIKVYDEKGESNGFATGTAGYPEASPATVPDDFAYIPGGTIAGSGSYAMNVTVPTDPPGYMYAGQTLTKQGVFVENRIVSINSFFMAKYETTQELYYEVQSWAEGNGYSFQNKIDTTTEDKNNPVTRISWRDAIVWCNAYSEMSTLEPVYYYQGNVLKDSRDTNGTACDGAVMNKSKNGYRLPTEVEREYSARGGDPGKIDWMFLFAGSNNADDVAWYHGNSVYAIQSVGTKNSNRLDIYDLSGNAQEWGWDWMRYSSAVTPDTPVDGEPYSTRFNQKPMAGGGVGSNITMSCVADRWGFTTSYRDAHVGFRLVRNIN